MSIFLIFLYMFVTVVFYSWVFDNGSGEGGYSVRESLYMAVVTFTTVGYGDILPATDGAKVFSAIHAFCGILFIGAGVGILVSAFIKRELQNQEQEEENRAEKMLGLMEADEDNDKDNENENEGEEKDKDKEERRLRAESDINSDMAQPRSEEVAKIKQALSDSVKNQLSVSTPDLATEAGRKELKEITKKAQMYAVGDAESSNAPSASPPFDLESSSKKRTLTFRVARLWLIPTFIIVLFGAVVGAIEGWTALDSIYWVIITACSVGYGDFYPTKMSSQWIAVFFIPISVGLMTGSISQTISFFFEHYAAEEVSF